MDMSPAHPNYQEFKKEFWEWFDQLPEAKKKAFWGYRDDMAETNFYFTVYSKKNRVDTLQESVYT